MINISIQNDCSLFHPTSVPLKIEEYQRKGRNETERGPMGLPGTEAFLFPISCRQDSSLHDLPWVPKSRFKKLQIKGGAARKPPEARLKGPEKLIKIRRPPETLHIPSSCQQPHSFETPQKKEECKTYPWPRALPIRPPYSPGREAQFLRR